MSVGPPTRFGLREAIEKKWQKIRENETQGDYHSTYTTSYRWHSSPSPPLPLSPSLPLSLSPSLYNMSLYRLHEGSRDEKSQVRRYATPRHLSSHLHPHHGNSNLALRGVSHLPAPEVVDTRLVRHQPPAEQQHSLNITV